MRVVHTVVFAEREGGGNPCPVVLGADDWDTGRMQALAAEFGHETAFVLPPRSGGDVRLRYFVPRHEMEMCVHATVASAVVLGRIERVETPLGVRRVWVDGSSAVVEQFPAEFSPPVADASGVLAALGASAAAGPVQAVSTARPKLMVPLASEAALDGLRPELPALWEECRRLGVTGAYPFCVDAAGADAATRQFPVDAGYDEDPATGVAACALGAYLDRWIGPQDRRLIAQGRAMGRPSLISVWSGSRVGGAVTRLAV